MSWWRTFAIVLVCGLAPTGLDAVMDRRWPDYSALHWLVLLCGFVVIGVGGHMAESMIARQRSATNGQGVGSGRASS